MNTIVSQANSGRHHQPLGKFVPGVLLALALLASSALGAAADSRNLNPRIIPPNALYGGLTYREWMAKFVQWYLSVPASVNPLVTGNEEFLSTGQPNHLWFLANTEPVVDRHFVVPARTALFATIFIVEAENFFCVEPDTNYTVEELRALAKSIVDSLTDIQVEVDGAHVEDVARYRSTTPVFSSTLPDGNILQFFGCTDALPGTYGPIVGDGYALILPPLPVGEHTIHEAGVLHLDPSDPSQDIVVDVTWRISVVPQSQ